MCISVALLITLQTTKHSESTYCIRLPRLSVHNDICANIILGFWAVQWLWFSPLKYGAWMVIVGFAVGLAVSSTSTAYIQDDKHGSVSQLITILTSALHYSRSRVVLDNWLHAACTLTDAIVSRSARSTSDHEVVGSSPAGCRRSRSNRAPVALCTLGLGLLNPPSSPLGVGKCH